MREILFRGKREDNGEWVMSGNLIHAYDNGKHSYYIPVPNDEFGTVNDEYDNILSIEYGTFYKVDLSTVGQFTGLYDKNGTKIFEGDIVSCWSEGVNAQGAVQQRRDGLWIIYPNWQKHVMWGLCPDEYSHTTVEIIGNVWDNPELLEGETE